MNEEAARAELARLKVKRREIKDADIRAALDVRIKALEEQVVAIPEKVEESVEEVPLREPTPREKEEADRLIAMARLERNRGNKAKATELMKQAADLAPGSSTVIEALGDDLAERKQWKAAKETYAKAHKIDPKNVGLERKLATAALRVVGIGSIEDQLRAGTSDSLFLNESDAVAGRTAAVVMSVFLPGLGHIVLGRTATGGAILATWIVLSVWAAAMWKDVAGLVAMAMGTRAGTPSLLVLAPLLLMIIVWIGTVNSLTDKRKAARKKIDHPLPPADLPFE
ncbi:tetratricopeptide repeat protein [bacterium]|nr:MAG: tetratricopeptide repeat protein [bacterium]